MKLHLDNTEECLQTEYAINQVNDEGAVKKSS